MITKMEITNPQLAAAVLQVQFQAYRVEAQLINCDNIPPLKDTVKTLQQCGEQFYGYYLNNELTGIISFKNENDVIDIHRLFVHPNYFKKGIAQSLLDFIQHNETGFKKIIVTTASRNLPAINLYLKKGFSKARDIQVSNHLSLTLFEKNSS
ncbi:GNAT family N-acetyltransferase [Bacillus rubiinfantis]|uniref:GNAT family N-acetyltransferase n=1 Tax=Bacillus rubiinfantis TaxID=1499680 RepID=UPI0005A67048|nr:GNAT family N-acetyltransferase [Bacillus rubiinfantis]